MSVVAYRLLHEVRHVGSISWRQAQARVPDAKSLDQAVAWLHERGLVAVEPAGLVASQLAS